MLDLALAQALLADIARYAIRLDLFNWGEPLLNPAFPEITELGTELGLYTRSSSHFSFDHIYNWASVISAGLKYIVASIDGASQETYGAYRVRGKLAQCLDNLAALLAERRRTSSIFPLVEWQFLAMRHNLHDIDAVRRTAMDIGVDVFRYGGARAQMAIKAISTTPEAVSRSANILLPADHPLSEYDAAGEKRRTDERQGCRWLWGKAAIHADGRVVPCWNAWRSEYDFGNGRDRTVIEIWTGEAARRARAAALSGGIPQGATICEQCAWYKSFVPPPDFDGETWPSGKEIVDTAMLLGQCGVEIPHYHVGRLSDGFDTLAQLNRDVTSCSK
jgi:radical SAM protein with 4Fe4S-binding SPASM domain